ncbi:hypothetical protein [Phocaeicola plebeius]|uniref:hypothetical protein n=1 Tax=Phocaeicola plebeius TaxID=310297 RepID=UPI00266C151E|nr:hypothetical protein [Phocaeicola plebeius]
MSYSKDTLLLISGEINNPSVNGLEKVLLFHPENIVSRCLCCPKEERDKAGRTSLNFL